MITLTEPVGPAGAPLLVLGPSLGTSTLLWEWASPLLRERYRVSAWDLPGHGRAPVQHEAFTTAQLATAVLEAVPDERFLYAGVSLGGAVGLEVLLAAPDRVAAAAIICSGAKIGTPEAWAERAAQVRSQGTASLVVGSAQRWFAPGSIERLPDVTGRLLHALRDADDESYARCAEALAGYDVRARLAEIGMPVLALWGEHDAITPEALARQIAEGVQHGGIDMIAGAAHLAPAEQPEAVASRLLAFFEGAA
jgi:3-oxoadipate enol-lactonase